MEEKKLDNLEYRLKRIEALVLALIKELDKPENRVSSIKFEYQNQARKLGINPDYPD